MEYDFKYVYNLSLKQNSPMHLDRYELEFGPELTVFEFVSLGRRGKITKIVQFQRTDVSNVYNLAFGDKNPTTGQFDDLVITNNGDSEKVLATVVAALYAFTRLVVLEMFSYINRI